MQFKHECAIQTNLKTCGTEQERLLHLCSGVVYEEQKCETLPPWAPGHSNMNEKEEEEQKVVSSANQLGCTDAVALDG